MSSIPIPSKGDIVTIDSKQYRVLKVTGTIVELLCLYTAKSSQKFNTTSVLATFTDGSTGLQYKDCEVDSFLNVTFYQSLSNSLRNSIVPKQITQDMWKSVTSAPTDVYYYLSGDKYYTTNSYGTVDVGSRYVYVLSIGEIVEYLGLQSNGTFYNTDVWNMFWNSTSAQDYDVWLRSANGGSRSKSVFGVSGSLGYFTSGSYTNTMSIRPAFQVDWDILYPSTPTLTFKHFYDAGLQGTGTIKFRHYSQTEPSIGETWVLNDFISSLPLTTTINFTSNNKNFDTITNKSTSPFESYLVYRYQGVDTNVYNQSDNAWINGAYRTITFATSPTGDLLTWLQANGTKQGGGGAVIKAGTYKWVDTPDVVGVTQSFGDDFEFTGISFTTDSNNFTGLSFNSYDGEARYGIQYLPEEGYDNGYTNHTTKEELLYCGYSNMKQQFGQQGGTVRNYVYTYEWVEVSNYKTITITSDYNLSTELGDEEVAKTMLEWFTANTTKLS